MLQAPLQAIHHWDDSISEPRHFEVDQQPHAVIAQLELRQELRLVNRKDPCGSLGLNHNAFLYQHVDPIRGPNEP
jgi:hypothetical protein